jgi:hypothetical protein
LNSSLARCKDRGIYQCSLSSNIFGAMTWIPVLSHLNWDSICLIHLFLWEVRTFISGPLSRLRTCTFLFGFWMLSCPHFWVVYGSYQFTKCQRLPFPTRCSLTSLVYFFQHSGFIFPLRTSTQLLFNLYGWTRLLHFRPPPWEKHFKCGLLPLLKDTDAWRTRGANGKKLERYTMLISWSIGVCFESEYTGSPSSWARGMLLLGPRLKDVSLVGDALPGQWQFALFLFFQMGDGIRWSRVSTNTSVDPNPLGIGGKWPDTQPNVTLRLHSL